MDMLFYNINTSYHYETLVFYGRVHLLKIENIAYGVEFACKVVWIVTEKDLDCFWNPGSQKITFRIFYVISKV